MRFLEPWEASRDAIRAGQLHVVEHQVKVRGAKIDRNHLYLCICEALSMLTSLIVMGQEQGLDMTGPFRPPGGWPIYWYNISCQYTQT